MIHDNAALHCLSDLILHWQNLIALAALQEDFLPTSFSG